MCGHVAEHERPQVFDAVIEKLPLKVRMLVATLCIVSAAGRGFDLTTARMELSSRTRGLVVRFAAALIEQPAVHGVIRS